MPLEVLKLSGCKINWIESWLQKDSDCGTYGPNEGLNSKQGLVYILNESQYFNYNLVRKVFIWHFMTNFYKKLPKNTNTIIPDKIEILLS